MKKILLSAAIGLIAMSASAQTVYFEEDFEWLAPWTAVGDGKGTPAADIVGTNQADTYQPQITKSIVDDVTAEQALLKKGYEFMRYDKNGPNAGECIYIQKNYLKFGKTGFQGSMTLPAMESLGSGVTAPVLSFDWYSQRQGSGVFDPTEIVIIVATGTDTLSYAVPKLEFENNAEAKWTRVNITLTGATLTSSSRITIRNIDSQLKSTKALRWHIDNIKLASDGNAGVEDFEISENREAVYYNLQGMKVMNLSTGVYIKRQGNKCSKIFIP